MPYHLDRREFLGCGLAAAAAPLRLPVAPNERVVVGVMGLNSRGARLAVDIAKLPDAAVGYLCDVDRSTLPPVLEKLAPLQKDAPKQVSDFRRMLDDPAVDAVVIATPDHWHAPAAIRACAAGKDVYVEKPCSHNPREGELLVQAAQKHRRIVQMGNQRRSFPEVIEAIEAARTKIGRAYFGRAWYANSREATGRRKPAPVPDHLDWDLWQGPAPRRPFTTDVVHYKWHWYWHWGTGELGNNAVHSVDLCRWALGVEYPSRVVSAGGRFAFDDGQETPDTQTVAWEFEGGRQISFENLSCNRHGVDGSGFGACILGTEGSVSIGVREWVLRDRKGVEVERKPIAPSNAPHLSDFFAAIRSRRAPHAEIAGGHRSTLLCQLGNIAHRVARPLSCDPKTGRILADPEAMKLWGRSYEDGWAPAV